jgi:hypothetical protein
LTPKPIVIAERFRFHKRNQLQCESVNAYIAELRKLTEFCEFELNLNDTLRDRFVCGLRNDQIQKKLLTIRELSLDELCNVRINTFTLELVPFVKSETFRNYNWLWRQMVSK